MPTPIDERGGGIPHVIYGIFVPRPCDLAVDRSRRGNVRMEFA